MVKYSILKTLRNWHYNPDELDKKVEYRGRDKSKAKGGKKSKSKKSKTPRNIVTAEMGLELLDRGDGSDGFVLEGKVTNNGNFPMQGINMQLRGNDGDLIDIVAARGRYVNSTTNMVNIEFLPAAMNGDGGYVKFQVQLDVFVMPDDITVKIEFDDTFEQMKRSITKNIEVKAEG